MASGTIPVPMQIGYIDDAASVSRTLTAGSNNYARITQSWIPTLPSGAHLFKIELLYWSSNTGAFSIEPYYNPDSYSLDQAYFFANSGVTLSGARFRWWYAITG